MQAAVQIRPMRIEDIAQVSQIDRLSFSLPWPRGAFQYELLRNKAAHLWVAEVGPESRIVGVIGIWLIIDEIHISTLAIHPDYRQHHIASQLLITALASGRDRGAKEATLEVRAGNEAALALYEKFGFEVVGRRKGYYQDNHEDALLMTLKGLENIEARF